MARSHQTIWNNQKELAKSEERLDEQFAVLTRLTISKLNPLLKHIGEPLIQESYVEELFKDWAKFKARPDRKEHMMEWFMGAGLDTLPPLQESKPMEEGGSDAEGNHGNTDTGEELSQDRRDGKANDVSQVQNENQP